MPFKEKNVFVILARMLAVVFAVGAVAPVTAVAAHSLWLAPWLKR